MSDQYEVQPREVLGKSVKKLRRGGVLPANIYGRGLDSVAVQLPAREARQLLQAHGTNTLIEVRIASEPRPRPVVVRGIQRHPVSRELQHLDFYQVELDRPIQGSVTIHLVGESPAVHTHHGILLQELDHVLVEALPANMPTMIELSIESILELDQALTVADLVLPEGVRVLSDSDTMLARVSPPRVERAEEVAEGEEAPAEGAAEPAAE